MEEELPDFLHLMDESGIIGLSEVVEGSGGWGESSPGDTSAQHDPSGDSETWGEEGTRTPNEDPSSCLIEHPSHTQSLCESPVQLNSLK